MIHAAPTRAADRPEVTTQDEPRAAKPVALIVDSDDLARSVTSEIVGAAGFEVHQAPCCDSAIATLVEQKRVDVLLVSTSLPELPGQELAAIIAKDYPDVRTIFLLTPGDTSSCAPALRKPFTQEDLERVLASLEAPREESPGMT